MTPEDLVGSATARQRVPLVGEITLRTTARPSGLWDLWHETGRDGPPFWAFPWAGGQALARYVLDNPLTVRDRRVLDVASGSGLVAIAAAKAGAASVVATDIDPNAVAAITANAAANGVQVAARAADLAAGYSGDAQVVLAGDVFYQRELADLALGFLLGAARSGAEVLVADPGRAYLPGRAHPPGIAQRPGPPGLPAASLTALAGYQVPVLTAIEDAAVKTATVYRLAVAGAVGRGQDGLLCDD